MKKLSLPHPELIKPFLTKMRIAGSVSHNFDGVVLNYSIYEWDGDNDPIGLYDEDGNIFISKKVQDNSMTYADLIAYHETKEIEYKRSDIKHDEAHWRAYVAELGKAVKTYNDKIELKKFLEWRLSIYSDDKIPDKTKTVENLVLLVSTSPYPAEQVLEIVRGLGL